MFALDTETTGLDLRHGAKPYLVTVCEPGQDPQCWEWDVDPLTREPIVKEDDITEIRRLLEMTQNWGTGFDADTQERHVVVCQNAGFDVAALEQVGITDWPWSMTRDTLLAGHLLASNLPHDLTSMSVQYLGVDIEPLEKALHVACEEARRHARGYFPSWRIAKEGLPEMPSAKAACWRDDGWLPRAMAKELEHPEGHPWYTVLRDYACADSEVTANLWPVMMEEIKRRGYWEVYKACLPLLSVAYNMIARGVTYSGDRLEEMRELYIKESCDYEQICITLAASLGHELSLPKSGVNASLRDFMFNVLKLEPIRSKKAKTDTPTLDKNAMDFYEQSLPASSKGLCFIKALKSKRKRDTAVQYLEGYKRFGKQLMSGEELIDGWMRLHPSLNITATATLRHSMSNPNGQNISTQETMCDECNGKGCDDCFGTGRLEGFRSLRYIFGPAPGREWWSLDYKNIERRIPAYFCREEAIIALFEHPDDPPYFGSEHLLVAHIIFPREFESCKDAKGNLDGRLFKKNHFQKYKRIKNGNFAVQYGAVDRPDGQGTADKTYGVPGAQSLVKARFSKQTALNDSLIKHAEKYGYVETIPDTTIDPEHGYPLLCARTEWNRILPTTPLNYWGQGSACHVKRMALIRCEDQLDVWRQSSFDGFITLEVHDEIVFDFPLSPLHPKEDTKELRGSNLWRIRKLQSIMAKCGDGIGVPTPVNVEYHIHNWGEGLTF